MEAGARRATRLDRGGQRASVGPGGHAVTREPDLRRNGAPADLFVCVCCRSLPGRDGRAGGPHVPDAASRDGRGQGGAQPRGNLRSARERDGLARDLHRDPVRLRQVRLRAHPVVPVWRHGARRRHLLQRGEPAARRVGHAEPAPGPREPDCARNCTHVVRRPGDDDLVQRRLDEGGLRQLHGGEDREPVLPDREPRPAVPAPELPHCVRRGPHGRGQPDSPGSDQPGRGWVALRRDHLPEGADRHASARTADGRVGVSRGVAASTCAGTSSATRRGRTWWPRWTR